MHLRCNAAAHCMPRSGARQAGGGMIEGPTAGRSPEERMYAARLDLLDTGRQSLQLTMSEAAFSAQVSPQSRYRYSLD
jgi:hypothetical protein